MIMQDSKKNLKENMKKKEVILKFILIELRTKILSQGGKINIYTLLTSISDALQLMSHIKLIVMFMDALLIL